ncbi:MAG: hypothetical protein ABI876_11235, partial [Bacteroidota bacterium]
MNKLPPFLSHLLIIVGLFCLMNGACAYIFPQGDSEYMSLARQARTVFNVRADSIEIFKSRARGWLAKYSQLPLEPETDLTIRTTPANSEYTFTYSVNFLPLDNKIQIAVTGKNKQNVQLFAYYL